MLFFDSAFLFAFLPLCLLAFYLLPATWRMHVLIAFSLLFYAMWRLDHLAILLVSMTINYYFIQRYLKDHNRAFIMPLVIFDLSVLIFFKYLNFILQQINPSFVPLQLALPLGISFYTFHQISLLLDLSAKRVKSITFREYLLYMTFFPQLIAGPIVRFPEVEKSLRRLSQLSSRYSRLLLGFAVFICGLTLKLLLADTFSTFADKVFTDLKTHTISSLDALVGGAAFYFQLFFDFSGYTAMALGLGIIFGIKLPPNFNRPYATYDIVSFWSRWHMTLTRLITDYLYSPMALKWSRWTMEKGYSEHIRFAVGIVAPTLLAFVLVGAWHGAGWTFLIFGLYHGALIALYRLYKHLCLDRWLTPPKIISLLLTQFLVLIGWIFFRAGTLDVAGRWFQSLVHGNFSLHISTYPAPKLLELFNTPLTDGNFLRHLAAHSAFELHELPTTPLTPVAAISIFSIGLAVVVFDIFQPRFVRWMNAIAMRHAMGTKMLFITALALLFHLCVAVTLYKHNTFIYFQF